MTESALSQNVKFTRTNNHFQSTKDSVQKINLKNKGALRAGSLQAGAIVFVGHFKSRFKDRSVRSRDDLSSDKYIGGYIYVDHMISYIYV